jgi:diadenosine tetraphosphate (Ap4A) HIT family hydrolase
MKDCIFCKIVKGEIDSAKIWENKNFIAILDIMPNTKGMTLVISKKHYDSYGFQVPEKIYLEAMKTSRKVAKILEKALKVKRVAMVMEGMGINHLHIKLYPLWRIPKRLKQHPSKRVFFKKYEGYISTQLGPEANFNYLKKLAEKISRASKISRGFSTK